MQASKFKIFSVGWQPKDEGKLVVRFQSEGWQPGDSEDLMVHYEVHRSSAGEFSLVGGGGGRVSLFVLFTLQLIGCNPITSWMVSSYTNFTD